jgi:hypothetical protein
VRVDFVVDACLDSQHWWLQGRRSHKQHNPKAQCNTVPVMCNWGLHKLGGAPAGFRVEDLEVRPEDVPELEGLPSGIWRNDYRCSVAPTWPQPVNNPTLNTNPTIHERTRAPNTAHTHLHACLHLHSHENTTNALSPEYVDTSTNQPH